MISKFLVGQEVSGYTAKDHVFEGFVFKNKEGRKVVRNDEGKWLYLSELKKIKQVGRRLNEEYEEAITNVTGKLSADKIADKESEFENIAKDVATAAGVSESDSNREDAEKFAHEQLVGLKAEKDASIAGNEAAMEKAKEDLKDMEKDPEEQAEDALKESMSVKIVFDDELAAQKFKAAMKRHFNYPKTTSKYQVVHGSDENGRTVFVEGTLKQRYDKAMDQWHKANDAERNVHGFEKATWYSTDGYTGKTYNTDAAKANLEKFKAALNAWMNENYPGDFEIEAWSDETRIKTPDGRLHWDKVDQEAWDELSQIADSARKESEKQFSDFGDILEKYAHSLIGKYVYEDIPAVKGMFGKGYLSCIYGLERDGEHTRHSQITKENGFPEFTGYTLDDIKDWKFKIIGVEPNSSNDETIKDSVGAYQDYDCGFKLLLEDPEGRTTYPARYDGREVPIKLSTKFVDWKRSGLTPPTEAVEENLKESKQQYDTNKKLFEDYKKRKAMREAYNETEDFDYADTGLGFGDEFFDDDGEEFNEVPEAMKFADDDMFDDNYEDDDLPENTEDDMFADYDDTVGDEFEAELDSYEDAGGDYSDEYFLEALANKFGGDAQLALKESKGDKMDAVLHLANQVRKLREAQAKSVCSQIGKRLDIAMKNPANLNDFCQFLVNVGRTANSEQGIIVDDSAIGTVGQHLETGEQVARFILTSCSYTTNPGAAAAFCRKYAKQIGSNILKGIQAGNANAALGQFDYASYIAKANF